MMIKRNNAKQRPYFHPSFGCRPAQIVGRTQMVEEFIGALSEPIGSKARSVFYSGQRGMGKTALLLELAERAEAEGYVTARVTAYDGMARDIIETIQLNGSKYIKEEKKLVGVDAGAFGFSLGLSFSEETNKNLGFRAKLTLLCDKLNEAGKGILILIDEAKTSEAMREVATTYQHLIGEGKDIAIVMAGLPQSVSTILNDKLLTFLNRAEKKYVGPISLPEIKAYNAEAFNSIGLKISDACLDKLTEYSDGFPYMMQLLGYYATSYGKAAGEINEKVIETAYTEAKKNIRTDVLDPILKPLSDKDMAFLFAMTPDREDSRISDIRQRLNVENSEIQPYRARLIESGIIESPRKGDVCFAVPYLKEYLTEKSNRNFCSPN